MAIKIGGGGALPKDANNAPIQIGEGVKFQDGNSTPVVSPFTTIDATVKTLTVPKNAVSCIFRAISANARVGISGTLDGTAGNGYSVIPNGSAETIDCAGLTSITFMRDAGIELKASFRFIMLSA